MVMKNFHLKMTKAMRVWNVFVFSGTKLFGQAIIT